jgi:O-antigen/teichoic acid export membrane protein
LRQVVCTLFWVFVAQSVLLALVSVGILQAFERLFDVPTPLQRTAQIVFIVVAMAYLLKLPMAMFRGVLMGDQKLWIANVYQMGANLLYFAAVLLLVPRVPSLVTFAWLNWVVTVLPAVVIAVHCALTMRGELSVAPRHFDWSLLREVWGFSAYQMIIQLMGLLGSRVDTFIVHGALPLTAVAVYAIALRVSEQARAFCQQLIRTLTPVLAELHSASKEAALVRFWLTGSRFSVAFAAPLILGCVVLAEPLITSWMGSDFSGTVLPLQLLLAATFTSLIHGGSQSQLAMTGDQRFLALSMCLGQVFNLGLSIAFVVPFGLPGVAAATLMGPLATDLCLLQPRLAKRTGVALMTFYRHVVFPSVLPVLVMVAFQQGLKQVWRLDRIWEVAVAEALNVLVFWSAFWRLGTSREERELVAARVKARFARLSVP